MPEKIILSGKVYGRIWRQKKGLMECTSITEAEIIRVMANKIGLKPMRRGSNLRFDETIDKKRYEWMPSEPAKTNIQPTLRSVE